MSDGAELAKERVARSDDELMEDARRQIEALDARLRAASAEHIARLLDIHDGCDAAEPGHGSDDTAVDSDETVDPS